MKKLICLLSLLLVSCGEPIPKGGSARILVLGDSMLAANRANDKAVADQIEAALDTEVVDRSVIAARYFHVLPISGSAGMRITAQFQPGPWDWVVLNGGGNDLLFGCGCLICDGVLNRLVSADGRAGAIPAYVDRIRKTGARVLYLGYLRNPGVMTPIKHCGPAGNELDRRLALMARFDAGVTFLPMADLVPQGDVSYHQIDLIHPSFKGSAAIAARVVDAIRAAK